MISVALDWLDEHNAEIASPYLLYSDDDEDMGDFFPPARSVEELRDFYLRLQDLSGSKSDILKRILQGDWRHGLTLYQLAIADLQHMRDHPKFHKWSAYRICHLQLSHEAPDMAKIDDESTEIPRFHPSSFVKNLQAQGLPDVKTYITVDRPEDLALMVLRIMVMESPYTTNIPSVFHKNSSTEFDVVQTVYIAFPDSSPHIYISRPQSSGSSGAGEANSLRKILLQSIPKALSRNKQRFALRPTNLTTKNLPELIERKGPGRTNAAAGGWSIYADTRKTETPLDTTATSSNLQPTNPTEDTSMDKVKARRQIARVRFGLSAQMNDRKGFERVDILLEDPPLGPAVNVDDDDHLWNPNIRLVFQGSHVFAGIRQLVEAGIIDGEKMPGWMTGEGGITLGVVRHGRIRGQAEKLGS